MAIRVALTPGDLRGIGPEVIQSAVGELGEMRGVEYFVHTPDGPTHVEQLTSMAERARGDAGGIRWSDATAGTFAGASIEAAVQAALRGEVQAIVTAPSHKPSLHAGGYVVPGQTELLRDLAGSDEVAMLMCAETNRLGAPLRVLLATTHIPLADVASAVTEGRIVRQASLLDRSLREAWAIESPRIAICALNPHASDGGLFGDEEARVLEPAVATLRDRGIDATGPYPADTVFTRALSGTFDAVVAPYHDVGMAAFKTASFGTGVNVSIGLPFVRTSPDHGTAFDIAGKGRADATSMAHAIALAIRLAKNRFDTPSVDV